VSPDLGQPSSTGIAALSVAVCIATYRRPGGLERLVDGLGALQFSRSAQPLLDVIIADNDPQGSAAAPCAELAQTCRWPMVYVVDPRCGIPYARNAAVCAARERGAELIAFIDDDEVPEPAWLDELLAVMATYQADVVTGPVLPLFEVEAPAWVLRGRFFERPRYQTGVRLDRAYTGNVLLRARVLDTLSGPFDERKALSGGTDTHLFLQVADAGHRIVWADGAVVHEWNPPSRLTARWLVRRAFRASSNWSSSERELRASLPVRVARIAKAFGRMAQGMILLPLGLLAGRHLLVRSLRCLAMGAGSLAGLVGREYDEYRVTHGS